MENNIKDYVPFMDKYPELHLRPTTDFPLRSRIQKYDYVQNLFLKDNNAPHGCFYLIVKDGLFGLYMLDYGFFWDSETVALEPEYESIDIYFLSGRHFRAIVKKNGKYGIVSWTYGDLISDKYETPIVYDSITKVGEKRFKAIRENEVVYYDLYGKILK